MLSRVQQFLIFSMAFGCGTGGIDPAATEGVGKADSAECAGASLDAAGQCRIAGRFAPTSCCAATCSGDDPLVTAAERLDARWGDRNISSSTLAIIVGDVAADADLAEFTQELLQQQFEASEGQALPEIPLTTSVEENVYEEVADEVVARIADEGFSYAPENDEDRCRIRWEIEHVLDWLDPDRENTVQVQTTGTVTDDAGERRNVTLVAFHNPATRRYLAFYVLQGFF